MKIEIIIENVIKKFSKKFLPLHEPTLDFEDKKILAKCIDSNFVSTVGIFVKKFEKKLSSICGAKYIIPTSSGTAALEVALRSLGVKKNHEILLPSLTFVASANSISSLGAIPHFIDVSLSSVCICEKKLENYLIKIGRFNKKKQLINKKTKNIIKAIMPVHVYGDMANMPSIMKIAKKFNLKVIEDSSEALGVFLKKKHAGTFGNVGVLSFNGNKIITTGGGGAILTDNKFLAKKSRYYASVCKKPHKWDFQHLERGNNYLMPSLNAALGCSQLKKIKLLIKKKKKINKLYLNYFSKYKKFLVLKKTSTSIKSNYWLNALILNSSTIKQRDKILNYLNDKGIQVRPVWKLMHQLPMYKNCPKDNLDNSINLQSRIILIPSSPSMV